LTFNGKIDFSFLFSAPARLDGGKSAAEISLCEKLCFFQAYFPFTLSPSALISRVGIGNACLGARKSFFRGRKTTAKIPPISLLVFIFIFRDLFPSLCWLRLRLTRTFLFSLGEHSTVQSLNLLPAHHRRRKYFRIISSSSSIEPAAAPSGKITLEAALKW
jgi:hypothetical protein